jgi:hypothetical protein
MIVPARSGPSQDIKRGALKINDTAVARTRVGNSSGIQHARIVNAPNVKADVKAAKHRRI